MNKEMLLWILIIIAMVFCDSKGRLLSYDVGVDTGVVRGYRQTDGDIEYFGFLGIPYAAPPTLSYRFKAPLRHPAWHGVFHANRTVQCPQTTPQGVIGNENCLVLNVFTPTRLKRGLLPVIVYIHGGGFLTGSGPIRGLAPLLKQNLIVVTMNYRLGVLGFLCLGIDEAIGNAGLKDQAAALHWVQRNILQFGGNPNLVTLYGVGAGGASVEFHVLSGISEGLFQRAIVESSSANSVRSMDDQPINTAVSFINMFGDSSSMRNLADLVRVLQYVPADELAEKSYYFANSILDGTPGFGPCMESKQHWGNTFISDPPLAILYTQRYTRVPIIFIYASMEGLFLRSAEYYRRDYRNRMNDNFADYLPGNLVFDTKWTKQKVAKEVKRFYFGNRSINDDTMMSYLTYFGDMVLHGLLQSAEIHSRAGAPVYLMEFVYKGDLGGSDDYFMNIRMAGHGDASKHVILTKPVWSWHDLRAVDRMTTMVSNFARFGNPIPNPTELLPVIWPQLKQSYKNCLQMGNTMTILRDPHWQRKRFWDEIYNKYGRPEKNATKRRYRPSAIFTIIYVHQIIILIM